MRPLFSLIPAPLLIVIALISLAITAEVAFAKTPKTDGIESKVSVLKIQARMGREQGIFDLKRGTAVAMSPMMFLEETDAFSDALAKKPMTCFLKDAVGSIRCQ
jgi:hypothetical protein